MTRRRRAELEQAVIAAALEWEAARRDLPKTIPFGANAYLDKIRAMEGVVRALRDYGPTETLDGPGSYVIGSPETSAESATLATPFLGSVRRQIIEMVRIHGHLWPGEAFTDEQLEFRLRRKHTTVSSARNWLVNAGWLRDSGYRRTTTSGRKAVCWCLTDAALERMRSPQWMADHARERQ